MSFVSNLHDEEKAVAESTLQSLRDAIDQQIAGSGPTVRERVIEQFVETERERRAKILVSGVNTLREAEADLNKINRGNVVHYDEAGKPLPAVFTKDHLTKIKKARERITKLEFALLKALSDAATTDDFAKLEKAVKSKGESSKNEDEDGDE